MVCCFHKKMVTEQYIFQTVNAVTAVIPSENKDVGPDFKKVKKEDMRKN